MARKRRLAGNLLFEGKLEVSEIATLIGVKRMSVYRWKWRMEDGGIEALRPTKAIGQPRRLKLGQREQLYHILTHAAPKDYEISSSTWDGGSVRTLISRLYGVTYAPDCCCHLRKKLVTPSSYNEGLTA